jgi:hypothetical protein
MLHNQAAITLAHQKGVAMARDFFQVDPIDAAAYNQASDLSRTFATYEETMAFIAGFRGERTRLATICFTLGDATMV